MLRPAVMMGLQTLLTTKERKRDNREYPFFTRNGLSMHAKHICDAVAHQIFGGKRIEATPLQGYCSYTVRVVPASMLLSRGKVVQFRPSQYAMPSHLPGLIKETYGHFAPSIQELGVLEINRQGFTFVDSSLHKSDRRPYQDPDSYVQLHVYVMEEIPGVPYSVLRPNRRTLIPSELQRQRQLVTDLAGVLAQSWTSLPPTTDHGPPLRGKVGSVLDRKLMRLALELPTPALRAFASRVQKSAHVLKRLPVVLVHGDLLPTNIMVDAATFSINGLVDWSESELLPFGICLYGLDHLLGFMDRQSDGTPRGFVYYDQAAGLRELFWETLRSAVPALESEEVREAVQVSRDTGVLLWYGFAFDDGRIDRVVQPGKDVEDLNHLEAFTGCGTVRERL